MTALRIEADENAAKVEELKAKVKELEQQNLTKEQEVTSLTHKNQVLETEVEKLETGIKEAKALADESSQHGTQNEALQRKLQMLEEETEEADKNMRETNEKCVFRSPLAVLLGRKLILTCLLGFVRRMSRRVILTKRCRHSNTNVIHGSPSMRKWQRSTPKQRRNLTTSLPKLEISRTTT